MTAAVPNNTFRNLATQAPRVTSEFLDCAPTGFTSFINDPVYAAYVTRVLGVGNDPARLFNELRLGPTVHHATRKAFKKWVAEVWLPRTLNPVKRGEAHWRRMASIIWQVYADAIALRSRTKLAIKRDTDRLARADWRRTKKMKAARDRRKARRNGGVKA